MEGLFGLAAERVVAYQNRARSLFTIDSWGYTQTLKNYL